MRQLLGHYRVTSENHTSDTFIIEHGGNHCHIANDTAVLFDGYTPEGMNMFEEKAKKAKELCEFTGWNFTRLK